MITRNAPTRVLLLGAGKIGRMIAGFLSSSGDYDVLVADADPAALARIGSHRLITTRQLDVSDAKQLRAAMVNRTHVISALSFAHNPAVAEAALELGLSYFDLTEDVQTSRRVQQLAAAARPGQVFMPQCGLAPGFVSIAAANLARSFDKLDTVAMRVGALPQFPTNALKYNLTWSTDGLINEYCNLCESIHEGARMEVLPLEGLENFSLDGVHYEAFNTSGGLGTLCDTLDGKVRELNYKTVRYLGHRDLVALLVNELRLSERRHLLKDVLEHAIPVTFQDVVVVFVAVAGWRKGQLVQSSHARKIYPAVIGGETWSAIQITTAAAVCAVLDMHATGKLAGRGLVKQEEVDLQQFLGNRFGRHYDSASSSRFCVDHTDAEAKP